eukprot:9541570-Karenia_brevis.AAC.1
MKDEQGNVCHEPRSIMDVFADFYASLYKSDVSNVKINNSGFKVPPVASMEVREQLAAMRKGKASDRKGIVTEMLQCGGAALIDYIADLFTAVLGAAEDKPLEWSQTFIS